MLRNNRTLHFKQETKKTELSIFFLLSTDSPFVLQYSCAHLIEQVNQTVPMIIDKSRGGKCAQIIAIIIIIINNSNNHNSSSILAQPVSRENMLHSVEHVNSYLLSVGVLTEL